MRRFCVRVGSVCVLDLCACGICVRVGSVHVWDLCACGILVSVYVHRWRLSVYKCLCMLRCVYLILHLCFMFIYLCKFLCILGVMVSVPSCVSACTVCVCAHELVYTRVRACVRECIWGRRPL